MNWDKRANADFLMSYVVIAGSDRQIAEEIQSLLSMKQVSN